MISFLQGLLVEKSPTRIVVDVGGIGYEVSISLNCFDTLGEAGSPIRLLTHLHVREDVMQLYGFASPDEREWFQLLNSVSGIGPKSALGILSGMTPRDLRMAITAENVALLTSAPGVGRKTAQRMIVELKEKIARMPSATAAPGTTAAPFPGGLAEEASMALVSLGYAKPSAEKAIARALLENPDREFSIEDLIKTALRLAATG